jgi:hypothetical protein
MHPRMAIPDCDKSAKSFRLTQFVPSSSDLSKQSQITSALSFHFLLVLEQCCLSAAGVGRGPENRGEDRKVGRWVLLVEAHLSIDHADEDHLTLGTQRMYVSINDRNDAGSIKVGIGPAWCDLLDGLSQVNRERGKFGCV